MMPTYLIKFKWQIVSHPRYYDMNADKVYQVRQLKFDTYLNVNQRETTPDHIRKLD